jgi:hypothetical protein
MVTQDRYTNVVKLHHRLYVTGGRTEDENNATELSAEYTEDGRRFVSLPAMPNSKSFHCMAVLESGDLFVASGDIVDKRVFLFDQERNYWKRCPDMLTTRGGGTCCAVIKRKDGKEDVVVIGGWIKDTVEIYSIEEQRWRTGREFTKRSLASILSRCFIG